MNKTGIDSDSDFPTFNDAILKPVIHYSTVRGELDAGNEQTQVIV